MACYRSSLFSHFLSPRHRYFNLPTILDEPYMKAYQRARVVDIWRTYRHIALALRRPPCRYIRRREARGKSDVRLRYFGSAESLASTVYRVCDRLNDCTCRLPLSLGRCVHLSYLQSEGRLSCNQLSPIYFSAFIVLHAQCD